MGDYEHYKSMFLNDRERFDKLHSDLFCAYMYSVITDRGEYILRVMDSVKQTYNKE